MKKVKPIAKLSDKKLMEYSIIASSFISLTPYEIYE
jgi:hypothetical protein